MKFVALTAATALLGAGLTAGAALAQSSTDPTAASPAPMSASAYVMAAGQSDLFEMQEGRLAEKMGKSARVRAFGRQMIADHTKSTHDVTMAARSSGMSPSAPMLRADQQQMIAQLQATSGSNFDKMYVKQQMQSHQSALQVQQNYMRGGSNKKLRNTASMIVPVVQHHIQELSELTTSMAS